MYNISSLCFYGSGISLFITFGWITKIKIKGKVLVPNNIRYGMDKADVTWIYPFITTLSLIVFGILLRGLRYISQYF